MRKIFVVLLLVFTVAVLGCSGSGGEKTGSNVPSGDNCAENVAYLQEGVNKYNEALGQFPADVNQLLESKDGKGPFVEVVPACPGGNIYVIENGIVRESPAQ